MCRIRSFGQMILKLSYDLIEQSNADKILFRNIFGGFLLKLLV